MIKLKKLVLVILGTFFILLGIIGFVLPIMPTTPFLILAGMCYINSSKRLYTRLTHLKYFGPMIESYVERGEVTRQTKTYSLLFIIIPTLFTQLFIVKNWIFRLIPILILILVIWHILSLKTVEKEVIVKNSIK